MKPNKNKISIPFKLINNLIFIPVELNGVPLTFLLDTGVEETVLFSLDQSQEVQLFQVETIKLKGLGSNEAVNAYKSSGNKLNCKGFSDSNHDLFVVLDQDFNFSSQVGIPVNGILGYHFFKNHKIEINYSKRKVIVYKDEHKKLQTKLSKNFFSDTIAIELNKPYLYSDLTFLSHTKSSKLLIDTGNSDALWVFAFKSNKIDLPSYTIEDYLGRGFSGEVHGKRGRITKFEFANHVFNNPITTFPDSTSVKSVNLIKNRIGSVGGEVLSRFNLVFDYPNKMFYAQPNDKINEPFNYNMSGIEVEHFGLEWVTETYSDNSRGVKINLSTGSGKPENLATRFQLKPVFKIYSVRKKSEAEKVGLKKGDKILKINGKMAHGLTIENINDLLKSEENREITIEVERNEKKIKVKFPLKKIL